MSIIYLMFTFIFGFLSLFYGKRLYFPVLMVTIFSGVVSFSFNYFEMSPGIFVVTIIVGIILALLGRFIYKLGIFLLGAILGFLLSIYLNSFLSGNLVEYGWIVSLILSIGVGLLALNWHNLFIILSTSFRGAYSISMVSIFLIYDYSKLNILGLDKNVGLLKDYLNGEFFNMYNSQILILGLILSLMGIIFQLSKNKKRR